MQAYLDVAATRNSQFNPSSQHLLGGYSKKRMNISLGLLHDYLNIKNGELIMTSGATESNNMVIKGFALKQCGELDKNIHFITTEGEHASILNSILQMKSVFKNKIKISYIPMLKSGSLDLSKLSEIISSTPNLTMLCLSIMNSETGNEIDFHDIDFICKNTGVFFHLDITQCFSTLCFDITKSSVNSFSASAHKFGGEMGNGIAYVDYIFKNFILPLISGGGQQNGLRSGTENVKGSFDFVNKLEETENQIDSITYRFFDKINNAFSEIENYKLYTQKPTFCFPRIMCMGFGYYGETIQQMLSEMGVYVSIGSACSSGKMEYNKTLKAMGVPENEVLNAIRISFDSYTTEDEIDYFIECMKKVLDKLKFL